MLALIGLVFSLALVQAVKFELPAEKHPKPSKLEHSVLYNEWVS